MSCLGGSRADVSVWLGRHPCCPAEEACEEVSGCQYTKATLPVSTEFHLLVTGSRKPGVIKFLEFALTRCLRHVDMEISVMNQEV